MCNTARHRLRVDLGPDSQVIIWTPQGPIACMTERQAASILMEMARHRDSYRFVRADHTPDPVVFETYDQFIARGGKVTQVEPVYKGDLPKAKMKEITLEDLGLA